MPKLYWDKFEGIIHVGMNDANDGKEHRYYQRIGAKNLAYFEPLKEPFERLQKVVGEEAKLFNVACGDHKGTVTMYIASNNQGSSTIRVPNYQICCDEVHVLYGNTEEVRLIRLDDAGLEPIYNALIIDVEGYQIPVLDGALKTLEKMDYVVIEVHYNDFYKNQASEEEVVKYMDNLGFRLFWTEKYSYHGADLHFRRK